MANKSGKSIVKVADFGLSKIIDEARQMETACGTPAYVGSYARSPSLTQSLTPTTKLLRC
jgi:hypothetical protein